MRRNEMRMEKVSEIRELVFDNLAFIKKMLYEVIMEHDDELDIDENDEIPFYRGEDLSVETYYITRVFIKDRMLTFEFFDDNGNSNEVEWYYFSIDEKFDIAEKNFDLLP